MGMISFTTAVCSNGCRFFNDLREKVSYYVVFFAKFLFSRWRDCNRVSIRVVEDPFPVLFIFDAWCDVLTAVCTGFLQYIFSGVFSKDGVCCEYENEFENM